MKPVSHTSCLRVFLGIALIGFSWGNVSLAQAEDFLFFSRSSEIGENRVWVVNEFSEGENILDLHIRRWENGGWTVCVPGADCSTNAGRLTWNTPLYAPVDGVIKTCWRNFDDNPKPGQKLKRVTGKDGTTKRIFTAGNHVNIETPGGNMVLIAHLKKGSLPSALCPFDAEEADVTKKPGESYPSVAIIPPGDRPQVRRGQFIGRAGNSGNSGGPHVHMHVKPVITDAAEGNSIPMPYIQGWAHPYTGNTNATSESWYELDSRAITASGSGPTMIHPSPFLRRASHGAGRIFSVDTVFLSGVRAVTAVEDSDHNLKLISWDFAGPETIIRKHDITAGRASLINLVKVNSSHVLVGVRDSNGNLKLILYSLGPTGVFTRRADHAAGSIRLLDMTVVGGGDQKIVTAVRSAGGNLKLIVWDVAFSSRGATITRLGSASAGGVSALALTPGRNFTGVIAAVRTSKKTLKVIPYTISANGMTLTRGADAEAGQIKRVLDITAIPKGVVAAMKDSAGHLRLISFQTSSAGNIVGRRATGVAGTISEVDIETTPHSHANVITSVRDGDGRLRIIAWTMTAKGLRMRRSGSSLAGSATQIATTGHFFSQAGKPPRDMLLTAVRDSRKNLKVINWEVNLDP